MVQMFEIILINKILKCIDKKKYSLFLRMEIFTIHQSTFEFGMALPTKQFCFTKQGFCSLCMTSGLIMESSVGWMGPNKVNYID